jgi:hypothetical protein
MGARGWNAGDGWRRKTEPPARCCSKSHRIYQIGPSTKPEAAHGITLLAGSSSESFRLIQMRSSAFSFEGARVVSIIVLMAANAVRFRCA